MNEPMNSAATYAAVAGAGTAAGVLKVFYDQDPSVVMCAFFGAVVFVLSAKESTRLERIVYLVVSFCVGLIGADLGARMLSDLLPGNYLIPRSIAALLISTVAVRFMQLAIREAGRPRFSKPGGPKS